jgi:hypothetical protein
MRLPKLYQSKVIMIHEVFRLISIFMSALLLLGLSCMFVIFILGYYYY